MNLQDQLCEADILSLIKNDAHLKKVANTEGGEYAGPCPVCGGKDRFRLWPNHSSGKGRFWCRQCGESGDLLDYLEWTGRASGFLEALGVLGIDPDAEFTRCDTSSELTPRHSEVLKPPSPTWQQSARGFVKCSIENLWSPRGEGALEWLRGRGLSDETIQEARLGYNPSDNWGGWDAWGLEARDNSRGVWLPRGVVIPWEIDGSFWRVNIRRPLARQEIEQGDAKYVGVAGSRNALYNACALAVGQPAILVEGEFDALAINQQARDLITAVATGSTTWSRKPAWIARLALCSKVLVAYDAEEAGDQAAEYWLSVLENARRWRPYWGDANAMAQEDIDLKDWIAAGLGLDEEETPHIVTQEQVQTPELWMEATELLARCDGSREWYEGWRTMEARLLGADRADEGNPYPVTLLLPADTQMATIGDQWHRLPDGRIKATYRTKQELAWVLVVSGLDNPAIDKALG